MESDLSKLPSASRHWQTTPEYQVASLNLNRDNFNAVTNLLLENPNLNSSHLFRADILSDTSGLLKTTTEKEQELQISHSPTNHVHAVDGPELEEYIPEAPILDGFGIDRCVKRVLIPRNPQLDKAISQTCYVYINKDGHFRQAVIYLPHVEFENQMPWYHPPIRALAYLFEEFTQIETLQTEPNPRSTRLSIHFLSFADKKEEISERMHRTFVSLLNTFVRLSKTPSPTSNGTQMNDSIPSTPSAFKDTILPQHLVQNTYTRLKKVYASDLISRWVERTEPSKHVFEDLSIAAFLIELWKQMYPPDRFPGFVDLACGNGVLVYILTQEGYHGYGLDARRRKTWEILGIDHLLDEAICIPKPFLQVLNPENETMLAGLNIHDGIFKPDTFIISNHADELTPWTPLLAALSSPNNPLPFLAIPCCSHALSGAKHRYTPKDAFSREPSTNEEVNGSEPQPTTGDLKSLRAAKQKAINHGDDKSMYACLTKKVVSIAQEIRFETELTLMRIPSTRNLGIVGNRKRVTAQIRGGDTNKQEETLLPNGDRATEEKILQCVERECERSGGVSSAAMIWSQRAQELQKGKGRGKVNLGRKPNSESIDST